jgi:hypothetical protein
MSTVVQRDLKLSEESLDEMISSISNKDENEVMLKNSIMTVEDLCKGMFIAFNTINHFTETEPIIVHSLNLMRGSKELMYPQRNHCSLCHATKT